MGGIAAQPPLRKHRENRPSCNHRSVGILEETKTGRALNRIKKRRENENKGNRKCSTTMLPRTAGTRRKALDARVPPSDFYNAGGMRERKGGR